MILLCCRNEEMLIEQVSKSEKKKIEFFENYEKGINIVYPYEWLNHKEITPNTPFHQSFKMLLHNVPNLKNHIENNYGRIEWDITTEVIKNETGDKFVYYPIVNEDGKIGFIAKIMVNKENDVFGLEIQNRDNTETKLLFNKMNEIDEGKLQVLSRCNVNGICYLPVVEIVKPKPIVPRYPSFGNFPSFPSFPPFFKDIDYDGFYPPVACMSMVGCIEKMLPPKEDLIYYFLCDRTLTLISKHRKAINEIKDHANKRTGSEIGRRFHKNGNVSEAPIINNHKLSVGNPNELDGFYHNHTGLGVDIFSPQDISSLIEIARFQDNGNKSNAFVGVIAYGDIHYVIRWGNNDVYSLPTFGTFTQEKLNELTKQQHDDYFNSFGSNQPDLTKEQRLEKVFYQTLDRMGNGIRDNIILQKIDRSNNVSTINLNADGSTSLNPCI